MATSGGPCGTPDPRDWLAEIIEGSDDAIISKDLGGVIKSWNDGATRLFGFRADEAVGKPITILIPDDRMDEELAILEQLRLGRRVQQFETKRRHKDGSSLDISLTVSPIRNRKGVIIGASKIARNITERRIAQEQQQLLMGEMRHRVKNLFAIAGAIVSLSARSSRGEDVIKDIQARLSALAHAHELTMSGVAEDPGVERSVPLKELISTLLAPYAGGDCIGIDGDDCEVGGTAITHLALLVYEFATNAAKYGSLSVHGRVDVAIEVAGEAVTLRWREPGGPPPLPGQSLGFGSRLEAGLSHALGATIERSWPREGLVATLRMPIALIRA